jgi:hypothetical protein
VEKEPAPTSCIYRKWDLTDSAVTPEAYYLQRRKFLRVVASRAFNENAAHEIGFQSSGDVGHWSDRTPP